MWGSEFTTKAAKLQLDSEEIELLLNLKFVRLRAWLRALALPRSAFQTCVENTKKKNEISDPAEKNCRWPSGKEKRKAGEPRTETNAAWRAL
jgi:hypothetical protein